MAQFLPLTKEEMEKRGWEQADFICVTGNAYVDHPSFGIAIISRLLEQMGFRVAMLSQPQKQADYTQYGAPKFGFFVTSGNIDSMVSHYTAAKRRRSDDPYTAGAKAGKRPDRAVIVYSRQLKQLYPDIPVILGGLEASFRRFAHYDYWDDAVRLPILMDAGADLLSFGMGEHQTRIIARRLAAGETVSSLTDIRGTCYLTDGTALPKHSVSCASAAKVAEDRTAFARAYQMQADEQDHLTGRAVVQKVGENQFLVQNPPMQPLKQAELDEIFALPFMRMYHPSYEAVGGVKAIEEVEFSIMHNRGCFGGCAFCSIAFHQGRTVTARSRQSVVAEAKSMIQSPRFKGYIHDVGGATANFRAPSCKKQETKGMCTHRRCLAPSPCPNLEVDHREYLEILRELRVLPGVKKVFVRSGLRFDYINLEQDETFLRELVTHHVSGQLKVAPEHCSGPVLDRMGKPHIAAYERFAARFYKHTEQAGKKQYLVPYWMSSHPGSTLKDAIALALFLKKQGMRPEQVQDFYPTPGTASTCMFYTGLDPATMQPVYVPRSAEEKAMQRALLQYFAPKNKALVVHALQKAGRRDLIGYGAGCLIAPMKQTGSSADLPEKPCKQTKNGNRGRKQYGKKK